MQVTDDLFDEIAQEVMDEDELRLLEGLIFIFLYICTFMSISSAAFHNFYSFTFWIVLFGFLGAPCFLFEMLSHTKPTISLVDLGMFQHVCTGFCP